MGWGNRSTSEERRRYTRAWYAKNKARVKQQRNDWAKANPVKRKTTIRTHWLKTKYGITPQQWEAMFDRQGRRCGICGESEPRGGRWAVDHNHVTKKLRGILCFLCNTAIGKLWDDPRMLERALGYLYWFENEHQHKEGM